MLTSSRINIIAKILLFQALGMTNVLADELPSSQNNQHQQSLFMPHQGQSLAQVASEFGEPRRTTEIEGKSSIRTWHYEYFSVYFREEKVIHSVRRHRDLLTIAAD